MSVKKGQYGEFVSLSKGRQVQCSDGRTGMTENLFFGLPKNADALKEIGTALLKYSEEITA